MELSIRWPASRGCRRMSHMTWNLSPVLAGGGGLGDVGQHVVAAVAVHHQQAARSLGQRLRGWRPAPTSGPPPLSVTGRSSHGICFHCSAIGASFRLPQPRSSALECLGDRQGSGDRGTPIRHPAGDLCPRSGDRRTDALALSGGPAPARSATKVHIVGADNLANLAEAMPGLAPMPYLGGVPGLRWAEVAGQRVGSFDILRCAMCIDRQWTHGAERW